MAAESSTASSSSRSGAGGGGASAESYIGSLISLTTRSEIRYEGILYNINTEESSIGLINVRSFGTEGRKKEGPQVPPSEKIYEYILFRRSDIKDLQVKASPPVQNTPPINSDPAIIQSHYPGPTPTPPANLPFAPSGPVPDIGPHASQMGINGQALQSSLPLYQPGGNLNSWGPSPPNVNGGLAMPMYWQGFYGAPNGLSQVPQQSLLRPPPGLPSSLQQMQFSSLNSSLPTTGSSVPSSNLSDYHSSLVPNSTNLSNITSSSLAASNFPLNVSPPQPMSLTSEKTISLLPNKPPLSAVPLSSPNPNLPLVPPLSSSSSSVSDNVSQPLVSSKPSVLPGSAVLPQRGVLQPVKSIPLASSIVNTETQTPSLVTPGQLLQFGSSTASAQPSQTTHKDVEVVQVSPKQSSEPSASFAKEAQPPILPLPQNARSYNKPNGGTYNMRHHYRGRGGRGPGYTRPVTKFTEDFDFEAMNEKFNKDEVWGHLGKGKKHQSEDKDGNESGSDGNESGSDEGDLQYEDDVDAPKIEIKALYNKDDFFDSLSCNALGSDPNHGRTRYSEQMKLDTETFGDLTRYRGGRGGRGGGGRHRGGYGRGYGGYNHGNRGRGRGVQGRSS